MCYHFLNKRHTSYRLLHLFVQLCSVQKFGDTIHMVGYLMDFVEIKTLQMCRKTMTASH